MLLFPARYLKWLHDDVKPDLHVPLAALCCVTVEQWKHFLGFKAQSPVPQSLAVGSLSPSATTLSSAACSDLADGKAPAPPQETEIWPHARLL